MWYILNVSQRIFIFISINILFVFRFFLPQFVVFAICLSGRMKYTIHIHMPFWNTLIWWEIMTSSIIMFRRNLCLFIHKSEKQQINGDKIEWQPILWNKMNLFCCYFFLWIAHRTSHIAIVIEMNVYFYRCNVIVQCIRIGENISFGNWSMYVSMIGVNVLFLLAK